MGTKQNVVAITLFLLSVCLSTAQAANNDGKTSNDNQVARVLCKSFQKHDGDAPNDSTDAARKATHDYCRSILKQPHVSAPPMHYAAVPAPDPPAAPQTSGAAGPSPCGTEKRLFVRADPIDNRYYAVEATSAGNAKGASISYTDERDNGTQTADVNGIVSYVAFGGCSGGVQELTNWAIAPWVSSSGTWSEPVKKTENEALKVGVDFQFGIIQPSSFIDRQFLIVSPFDQTDFRGTAHASGVDIAYEPQADDIYLNQSNGPLLGGYLDGYWQILPEVEIRQVTSAGLTNLKLGDYEWFGGTARGNLFLFTNAPPGSWAADPAIANRISLIGTAQYFWDSRHSQEARNYSAEVQYKLSGCSQGQSDPNCQTGGGNSASASSSSISFEYDYGTDKDTLVFTQKYLAKLNYKY
jgi:hypothetical protein